MAKAALACNGAEAQRGGSKLGIKSHAVNDEVLGVRPFQGLVP